MTRWGIFDDGVLKATVLHPTEPTGADIGLDLTGCSVVALERAPDPRFETASPSTGAIESDAMRAAEAFAAQVDEIFEERALALAVPEMKQRMHRRKEAEARALLVDPEAETPMLSAEAAQTGQTVAEIAAAVLAKVEAAIAVDADREAARRGAKLAVRAAADAAAMQIITNDFRDEVSLWT
ncbi:hypothetical protein BWQ93_05960 [Sphingopyxis sp. QXT-31]|uniref:hypothetical protein n=1 Tax=Sphingopyxis sp. QXT-31 TaxID=1357916 RepID=UPI00097944B2|nr:hypothetical protein [Sphingopyxis sp. QXT-31]APZ98075.1 hypothetical protein BWQ93_05960 [Sphingopyxis sp. QXT-31]